MRVRIEKGRASVLSDAINIALQDVQSEIAEAERRAEAARQAAILEEQAYESRRHNEAMERAEREHNMAMERAAKDQAREAAKQRELAEKQYNDAKRAASARCMKCANYSKCTYEAKQNAVNCAGYVPR